MKVLVVFNLLAVALFTFLALMAPLDSELSARMAYTELDRAGAINSEKLNPHDPRYAFDPKTNLGHRGTVPIFIAGSALNWLRVVAYLGLTASGMNVLVCSTFLILIRPTRHSGRAASPSA